MARKSRPRRGSASAQTEFALVDSHSSARVRLLNPLRFWQLLRRGIADQIAPNVARLRPFLALVSDALADNGEPRLRAVNGETIWPRDAGCPTGSICETLWRLSGQASFTLDEVEQAVADRQAEIERETLLWGLPDVAPYVLSRQFE